MGQLNWVNNKVWGHFLVEKQFRLSLIHNLKPYLLLLPRPVTQWRQLFLAFLPLVCLFKLRHPHSSEHPQLLLSLVLPIPGFSVYHSTHLSTSTFMRNEVQLLSNQRYPTLPGISNLSGVDFWNHRLFTITYRAITYKMRMHSHCLKNLTVISDLGVSFSWDLNHPPLLSPFLLTNLNSQCLLISASRRSEGNYRVIGLCWRV